MIKHYCDVCKKEQKEGVTNGSFAAVNIRLDTYRPKYKISRNHFELCDECLKKVGILKDDNDVTESIESKLYDILYDIVQDCIENQQ